METPYDIMELSCGLNLELAGSWLGVTTRRRGLTDLAAEEPFAKDLSEVEGGAAGTDTGHAHKLI